MMYDTTGEIMLVQRAQDGNQAAYEELIKRYSRLVWATVYGIISDPAGTEDLVQETFLKGWLAIKSLREPGKFRGWLLIIARRIALQHSQTLSREGEVLEDIASQPVEEVNNIINDDAEGLRQQLHQGLRELPDKYKLPLTLRYLEGFDYKKISETLDLSDGVLRGLLNRGMKLLRQKVQLRASSLTD